MQLSDKIKKFSVEQAVDYLNKNPVKNLPKLLDWADTFCKGEFENQRRAIRKACLDPTDAHSTDPMSPETAEHLCSKCDGYAACWTPVAEQLWRGSPDEAKYLAKQAAAAAKKK